MLHLLPEISAARGSHVVDPFRAQAKASVFSSDRTEGRRHLGTESSLV